MSFKIRKEMEFHGPQHFQKTVQGEAEIKAVHAQGSIRALQAQSEIIAILERMKTVTRGLMRRAGSARWKKAAIEQAGLLDKMLEIAMASKDEELVAAVQRCHNAWGDGSMLYHAPALSGMTVTECLAKALEEKHPIAGTSFWPSFSGALGRNLILPIIGCGAIGIVCTLAARKTKVFSPASESGNPSIRILTAPPAPEGRAVAVMVQMSRPIPRDVTPAPSQVEATATPSQPEEVIRGKAIRSQSASHHSMRQKER